MSHLHPERWPELEPEFIVHALLQEAFEAIEGAKVRSDTLARAHLFVQQALQALHECTRDPEAREEFSQRRAGTYEPGKKAAPPKPAESDDMRALKAQLAEMQKRLDASDAAAKKDPPQG